MLSNVQAEREAFDAKVQAEWAHLSRGAVSMVAIGLLLAEGVVIGAYDADASVAAAHIYALRGGEAKTPAQQISKLANFAIVAKMWEGKGLDVVERTIKACGADYKATVSALVKIKADYKAEGKTGAGEMPNDAEIAETRDRKAEKTEPTVRDDAERLAEQLWALADENKAHPGLLQAWAVLDKVLPTLGERAKEAKERAEREAKAKAVADRLASL